MEPGTGAEVVPESQNVEEVGFSPGVAALRRQKSAVVELPFGLTLPFRVADSPVMSCAGSVIATGGSTVMNGTMFPKTSPPTPLLAITR